MSIGVPGGLLVIQKAPAPAAAATVTAADNGTSLNGTTVELGQAVGAVGNPGALLNNREIPLSGFSLDFNGNNIDILFSDGSSLFRITDTVSNFFVVDIANGLYQLGNTSSLKIDDVSQIASIDIGAGSQYLYIDPNAGSYWLGDIPGLFDSTYFYFDNTAFAELSLNGVSAFLVNGPVYEFGDRLASGNGTHLNINDTTQRVSLNALNGFTAGDPGAGSGLWRMGKVIAGAVALDGANYVEVMIDGAIVKILKAV
jgi:hypothetical protein